MQIHPLFPTAIMSNQFFRDFTKDELDIIASYRNNVQKTGDMPTANETSIDTKVLDNPGLAGIRDFIEDNIALYVENVEAPKQTFETYITHSLVNFTDTGKEHRAHIHPNSFISGVLYIHAREDIDRIVFFDNNANKAHRFPHFEKSFNDYNSPSWWFPVWTGRLVIFPSNLRHCVEQSRSHYTRISLVFNTFIRGTVGSEIGYDNLTFR
jgi:uncharacterized protein (TIGR02466 family)